ncbi:hypothetical protein GCM10009092_25750 [Bowmanella denitrificans]|uniref:Uncharacterized protein n=1 Tax=Bowmanella denitrificans TaxID=366582 RepID=A0ABN0XBZ8_9ALTE
MKFKISFLVLLASLGIAYFLFISSDNKVNLSEENSSLADGLGDKGSTSQVLSSIESSPNQLDDQTEPELAKPVSDLSPSYDSVMAPPQVQNEAVIESFDQLLTEKDGKIFMDARPVELMELDNLSLMVSNLSAHLTSSSSARVMADLSGSVKRYTTERNDVVMHDMQCSNVVCGLMLESYEMVSIQDALNDISSSESFKQNTRGGVMRILEENGIYYGVIVTSISDTNITIK